MIKFQKIIKYFAIAFAISLIISIFMLITQAIVLFSSITNNNSNQIEINEDLKTVKINTQISKMEIDVTGSKIVFIEEGSKITVQTDNEYIKVKERNNQLIITEEKHNIFNINNNSELIIYIPKNTTFEDISIDSAAGGINIDYLKTKELELSLGAGEVNINNLTVLTEADIDGGAGEVNIQNSQINNLDLDMGIGKVTINGTITGINEINAGVGELNINLSNSLDNYKIKLNKGIGSALLNKEKMKNDIYYGEGNNLINIDGGIGNINVNYSR